jgi:Flp pilus assembly pilin Flp
MLKLFTSAVVRFHRQESGATLVEYAIALIVATTLGATVIGALGTDVFNQFTTAEGII